MLSKDQYYLKVGRASDLKDPKERRLYRMLEILPGALAWSTILSVVFLSWFRPVWVAIFIITFDVYWLFKTLYFSIHLRASYTKLKKQMKINWLERLKNTDKKTFHSKNWQDIYHLVFLPYVKEGADILGASVEAILQSNYPKNKIIVVLSAEERGGQAAQETAKKVTKKYKGAFFKILAITHPDGIIGELKGKGANSTWSIKQVKKKIIDPLGMPYENIVVSCLDSDTQIYPEYFSCLTYHYLIAKRPTRTSYQPVPIYNNNIWRAPCFSRVVATSATFWQMIQQQRPERLSSYSSHSISFQALVDTDFWPVNMVSEDSRIFWQCLLYYNGDYQTVPLNYSISMDADLASSFLGTAKNVYIQQRRWGWGSENIPYVIFGFIKNKKIPWQKKFHWTWIQLEGFWSWSTNALLIFLLGWLPLFLGGERFNVTLLSYNLPRVTRTLMTLAMVGLVGSAIYSMLLLPKPPKEYRILKKIWCYFGMIIQWILVPFTILIFGCLPGLDAQTRLMLGKYMGFWVMPKGKTSGEVYQ